MDKKEKAGKDLPLVYDELNHKLTMSLARLDEQNAALMALAARVLALEAFCRAIK